MKGLQTMSLFRNSLGLLLIFVLLAGCGAKVPHRLVPEFAKRGVRLLAVLPVQNESADAAASGMLREKLVEELYYKGYPKVSTQRVDEALVRGGGGRMTPQAIGGLLKVDALLYVTLKESRMGSGFLYGRTIVAADFELMSARTGESLWRAEYQSSHRHFSVTRKNVELKASQVYEEAILEVLRQALSTLPDAEEGAGA